MRLADWILGPPLSTRDDARERLGAAAGVGVLGLDALASAAYGPEALLTVLIPLKAHAVEHLVPLVGAILLLLAVVGLSYRQTIAAYPNGGGAYTIVKENLGEQPALLAAAALALDYLLNAAVAVSAGVGALVSAIPSLLPHTLPVCLFVLLFLTLINLRGVRATGAAFLLPTYAFVLSLFVAIAIGAVGVFTRGLPPIPQGAAAGVGTAASAWLLLRAFANGCTALTGIEAVSNGVPIFKEPAARTAGRSLLLILGTLMVLLAGIAFLCRAHGIVASVPGEHGYQSILSKIIQASVGRGPLYYVMIGSVIFVLALSANTSFADFPRVCRMLARDRFLPEPFIHRGRRLAFSHGIIVLSVLAAVLLLIFGGMTEGLVPLFAVGALSAFTMSQVGMVAHWRRQGGTGARWSVALNAVGALATGATLLVVITSKFREGAWLSLALVVAMLVLFRRVRRHYDFIAEATATNATLELASEPPIAVVPLRRWDAVSLKALRFALSTTSEIIAVQVLTFDRHVDDLSERWDELVGPVDAAGKRRPELVVLRSEYRQLFQPLVNFILQLAQAKPDRQIAVVVPELIETRWYQRLLHNQTASFIRALLLLRGGPQIVVITTPWYLRDWLPERRRLLWRRRALPWSLRRGVSS
ncbi:MAG: APC family permease [Myxococcota bacterium]